MKVFAPTILLLGLIAYNIAQEKSSKKFATEKNLLVLEDDTMEAAISKYSNVLVYFYVPWCTHTAKISSTL